jgi:radical S-adenosyl methionine domain-containing protein 2
MGMTNFISSVNFHLWEPCNMRCGFCFAKFQDVKSNILPRGHLTKNEAIKIVSRLAEFGFKKITFAGGEPTLCPWLSELIRTANKSGMTTMIVSNGTLLNNEFLERNKNILDWISISIDSLDKATNLKSGRAITGRKALLSKDYMKIVDNVLHFGYRLKINTVVNRNNFNENMNDFIQYAKPERWKVLQALSVEGQNDEYIDNLTVSKEEFMLFVQKHKANKCLVAETDKQMVNSYVMIDPAGRFFNNETGKHIYSREILVTGVDNAFNEMNYDFSKFENRKGLYNWKNRNGSL